MSFSIRSYKLNVMDVKENPTNIPKVPPTMPIKFDNEVMRYSS